MNNKIIQKIILSGAGAEYSNGEFLISNDDGNNQRFVNQNKSYIEKTIDGWILIDFSENDQTYAFDENFENVFLAGRALEPVPAISVIEL
jgi:hypothetical protein